MTEVVFVGTSDAFGAGGRRQAAIVVRGPAGTVLLDCGPTTCTGLAQVNVAREEIDAVLLSHFHGDHIGGLPLFLYAALYEDRRRKPLYVAGPPGTEERVRTAATAVSLSLEGPDWTFPIHFSEHHPGAEEEVGPVILRVFETRHQPETNPHGLDVSTANRRIVYSGDTGWFDTLAQEVGRAELFICECTYDRRSWEMHLSLEELSEKRRLFGYERIILTHLGSSMQKKRGACEFETADDGLIVRL